MWCILPRRIDQKEIELSMTVYLRGKVHPYLNEFMCLIAKVSRCQDQV